MELKKYLLIILISLNLTSCVTINSIVDNSLFNQPYKTPLIIIPYENQMTQNFVFKIKEKFEEKFKENQIKVQVLLFEKEEYRLKLNNNPDYDKMINESLKTEFKDIIIIFRPTEYGLNNVGGVISVWYEIIGIDTITKKEVWKARFNSQSGFGPAFLAEESANTIFKKLKSDKIIN